ncbi:MAG TPA: helix-turn-helix domain-containing protein, partial [Anaerolineae bacterium]|nr:helix-turn-helix domain-containing protein [Anaerolineae bacterium]
MSKHRRRQHNFALPRFDICAQCGYSWAVNEEKTRPLGDWLRQRREELGISLEQAEEETRIRICSLEALENENFDDLPDPVVGRGFLRNYAAYLGLDPQEAAERYNRLVAPPPPEVTAESELPPTADISFRPVPLHNIPGQGRKRWGVVLLVLLLAAALAVLIWRGYPYAADWLTRRAAQSRATPTQSAVEIAPPTVTHTPTAAPTHTRPPATETDASTPTLEPTFTPTWTPSPSPSPSPPIYTGIFLELVFTDTSWIQVTVDGVREFQGELPAETRRSWYGEERIELRVGNAGAVQVTLNGQSLGTLGAPGEVVDRVFEKVDEEVIAATP